MTLESEEERHDRRKPRDERSRGDAFATDTSHSESETEATESSADCCRNVFTGLDHSTIQQT